GQKGAAEIELVGGLAVFGVDPVEVVVIGVDTATHLEAKGLVGGTDVQAAFGFDDEIGAVGGDRTGMNLGGNGQGQSGHGSQGKRRAQRHSYSLKNCLLIWVIAVAVELVIHT